MPADPTQPAEPTDRPCPRCSAKLFEGRASHVTLLGCGACGGVWLSNEQSKTLVERLDRAVLDLSDRAAAVARGKSLDGSSTAYCPYDRLPLAGVTVRGVTLDVCEAHGTWFDAGEVRRVAQAYHRLTFVAAAPPRARAHEPAPTFASSSVLDPTPTASSGPTLWDFVSAVTSSSSSSITWSSDTSSSTSSWLDSLGSSGSSDSGGSWGGGGGDFGGGGSSSDY